MPDEQQEAEETIGGLFQQLVDEGHSAARTEFALVKAVVRYRLAKARSGAIALAFASALALGAMTVLLVMLAEELAVHIGPVGAGMVVAGTATVLAFGLLRWGANRLKVLLGDDDEKRALETGKRRA